jgi:NADH-quinone oxidoreductase subunit N
MAAITSQHYLKRENLDGVEAYVLLAMSAVGAMLMAASGSLMTLFLGLEIMSIALYVLAAYHRNRVESGEAGFKYFILGSFSSAIFLYGIALMYGATGSVNYANIALFLSQNTLQHSGVLLAGMGLLIVGLGFKVAAVPFHFWTPDVYQGTPTPFTGYMAAVAKAAGFAGLLRILNQALPSQEVNWRPIIWILTVLTVFLGSLMALSQKDLKRAFAYSSVSQAGFVLVGVEANSASGTSGALFYLFTYTFIVIGTFAIIGVIQGKGEARDDLGAVRGLSRRDPLLAGAFLVLLLAQAGVPLTSGFLAKFYVIDAVEGRGQYWLAIIAMLSAAIVAFFYLRIAILMYSAPRESVDAERSTSAPAPALAGARSEVLVEDSTADDGDDLLTARLETEAFVIDPSMAGLEPIASLDGERSAVAVLEAPTKGRIPIPPAVGVVIAVCVIFTIAAGVSGFMIDFARAATF